ncbi:cobyrinate a,c-diamide synthase [Flavobacterium sp. 7A]|uniref:cobyrinate a,c-diamide synthase n=1 Tax=Flavobacterium sp. 7A TaxID=2940571 RepID=UPI0022262F84|nr:cobyrinate a,c-diamide synthase [Flavobacterium sp. 7A]MCW2119683.1 cobyrinic acid a,c-diamide synthase [Flavobacterium sp. 7A]
MEKPQFIIAAPTSNSGKTTLTLGLLRALEKRGNCTQAFKVGPDYIDPKFHELANGKPSLNLDLYMMSEAEILEQYAAYSLEKDVVCVEGVMGLFDGARKDEGSTAAVAKVLDLPVVLVVNAKSVAYSVAPLLYGFKNFDPKVTIAGVIFNKVNTESHYQFLKEACEDVGMPSFGYVPMVSDCEIPSRHLGLSISAITTYDPLIDTIAEVIEATVDLDSLLKATTNKEKPIVIPIPKGKGKLRIAVAKDESFNFSYIQNIASLEELGSVCFFSPLHDSELPKADLVYFPGGYPELYTAALASNQSMLEAVKQYAEKGGRILAECGGMMYLGKSLIDLEGKEHYLVGVFDFSSTLENKKLTLGYRSFQMGDVVLKGHEFHYSSLVNDHQQNTIGTFTNARGMAVTTQFYRYKNVSASYMHYYLGSPKAVADLCGFEIE